MTERKAGKRKKAGISQREARAWRECAEWCATGALHYLCNTFKSPKFYAVPAHWPSVEMRKRLRAHADMHAGTSNDDEWGSTLDVRNRGTCPQDDRNDTRVIFCLLMAHECEGGSDA